MVFTGSRSVKQVKIGRSALYARRKIRTGSEYKHLNSLPGDCETNQARFD
jgi:hypothetical protein